MEAFALEEGKTELKRIGQTSFSDLWGQIEKDGRHRSTDYQVDILVRGLDNRISYERVTCPIERLYRLSQLEKRALEFHVHEEKKGDAV